MYFVFTFVQHVIMPFILTLEISCPSIFMLPASIS